MTKKVLVTDGSGLLGRHTIKELQQNGYDVLNADQDRADGVQSITVDMQDAGQVYSVVSQASAIIHLAAIPTIYGHTPHVVFRNNALSTFNILQAASDSGIQKVVIAGSLSALGVAYKTHPLKLIQS